MNRNGRLTRLQPLVQPVRDLSPRREVIAMLLLLAEVMIIFLLAGTFLAERDPPYAPLSFGIIFVVLFVSYLIPHLLNTIRIWSPEYEAIMTVSIVGTFLFVIKVGAFPEAPLFSLTWIQGSLDALTLQENESVRPIWVLIVFAVYAWWRGKTRAEANLETAYTMLRLGLIWITAGMALTFLAAPSGAAIFGQINAAVVGFLVCTLMAIAIGRQPAGPDSAAWSAGWVWLLVFIVPIVAIAGIAVTTTGVLDRSTLEHLLLVISPFLTALQFVLQALVLVIAVVAFILLLPLIWFLERQGVRPLANLPVIDLTPGNIDDAESFARNTLHIENPARYLIAGVILLGLIWLLIRYSFRRRRHWQEDPPQHRESLIDWEPGGTSLLQRARDWVESRIRPRRTNPLPDGPEWEHTRRIRRTYQQFLRTTSRMNIPREPEETPAAFGDRVGAHYSTLTPEINEITDSYNQARYSGTPALERDARRVEQALKAIGEGNLSNKTELS